MSRLIGSLFALSLLLTSAAFANLVVPMHLVSKDNNGKGIGTVTIKETAYGLEFIPDLHGLSPGIHGFHIHQNPDCSNFGEAAGGHWIDSGHKDEHLGPYNNAGHEGDLPVLIVNQDKTANLPLLAPRLKSLTVLKGHSLMIHEGGDNYSDVPVKLGGGGKRIACGIIKGEEK